MNKLAILSIMAGVIALGLSSANIAMAQLYGGGVGTDITATPEQLEECEKLGIPEFACTQTAILAKRRIATVEQLGESAYGSGTPMIGRTFGELGGYVAALGAIFGGVSAAFFAMALRKPKPQQRA